MVEFTKGTRKRDKIQIINCGTMSNVQSFAGKKLLNDVTYVTLSFK